MSQLKLTADGGGGTVAIKAPASTTGNAAIELTVPGTGNGTLLTSATSTGKVLQTIMVQKTDTTSHASGAARNDISGITVNITPSATSSKILIMSTLNICGRPGEYGFALFLMRDSTTLAIGDASSTRTPMTIGGLTDTDNAYDMRPWHYTYLDSPNTTSQVTYKWQWDDIVHSQAIYLNRSYTDADGAYSPRGASNIIVQEIGA